MDPLGYRHSYFDNVMTKFMINNRTDALKTVSLATFPSPLPSWFSYKTHIASYFDEEEFVSRLQVEVVCLNVISVDTNRSLDVFFLQIRKEKT